MSRLDHRRQELLRPRRRAAKFKFPARNTLTPGAGQPRRPSDTEGGYLSSLEATLWCCCVQDVTSDMNAVPLNP